MNISLSLRNNKNNKEIKNRAGGELTAVTRLIKTLVRETTQTDSVEGGISDLLVMSLFLFFIFLELRRR